MRWVKAFHDVGIGDVSSVGGKNASLGEMIRELAPLGVRVPGGFAVTADAYRHFIDSAGLWPRIEAELRDTVGVTRLERSSEAVRAAILAAELPSDLVAEIDEAYRALSAPGEGDVDVAVRSSATAEDLPNASFAGQQESFLNVRGSAALHEAVKRCIASLFLPRAINYRRDMGFSLSQVALSVGVQRMVRSDLASSGVIFSLDPESGHREIILVSSSWGLGENVVQGKVEPDQFYVHKTTRRQGYRPIVWKKRGAKELRMVYGETGTVNRRATPEERAALSLGDDDVLQLAAWTDVIEAHYSRKHGADTPMDIEWAKDGRTGELFIVQARPETVQSRKRGFTLHVSTLDDAGRVLVTGAAIGDGIAAGRVRVVTQLDELRDFKAGDILVAENTDPDWEPVMKAAAAIITDRGGRTSHAAIVARELGVPAVVGTGDATRKLADGTEVTVACAGTDEGKVYAGKLRYHTEALDLSKLTKPRTKIMLNAAQPEKALRLAALPVDGVGLARMEFIFSGWVGVHPLALTRYAAQPVAVKREIDRITAGYTSKTEFFVDKLAQGIGMLAAAFYPRPVILRFSDFKTNEYAKLVGGAPFEPHEENPMLGWRGASRYYHPEYKEGFLLEAAAVKRVREVFGLKNLKVMIPFCRTPHEGEQVLAAMREGGLVRGHDGLEVYVMAEIPSNVDDAAAFAGLFDGFSIGSNDLTQLILGVDRDADRIAALFDERNPAVKRACAMLLETAHAAGAPVGICGQAPSDYPDFAAFLVEHGIDSISLNADAVVRTSREVLAAERALADRRSRGPEEQHGVSRPEAH